MSETLQMLLCVAGVIFSVLFMLLKPSEEKPKKEKPMSRTEYQIQEGQRQIELRKSAITWLAKMYGSDLEPDSFLALHKIDDHILTEITRLSDCTPKIKNAILSRQRYQTLNANPLFYR